MANVSLPNASFEISKAGSIPVRGYNGSGSFGVYFRQIRYGYVPAAYLLSETAGWFCKTNYIPLSEKFVHENQRPQLSDACFCFPTIVQLPILLTAGYGFEPQTGFLHFNTRTLVIKQVSRLVTVPHRRMRQNPAPAAALAHPPKQNFRRRKMHLDNSRVPLHFHWPPASRKHPLFARTNAQVAITVS